MSFSSPFVLIALLAIPALIAWYASHQRNRARAAEAFVAPALTRSVAPKRPGWRRHAPMIAFALALAVLIVAAARPQRTKAVPINSAAIMLANDVSNSMQATDVSPTRLAAAKQAASKFVAGVPGQVLVGQMQFARRPLVLQSPTTDHAQTQAAIAGLNAGGGGTAIGETLTTALHSLTALKSTAGKRLPSAIVLLSDGTSNVGENPLIAARQAKADHIPIYTIAIGTAKRDDPGQARQPDGHRAGAGEPPAARRDRLSFRRPRLHGRQQRGCPRRVLPSRHSNSATRRSRTS